MVFDSAGGAVVGAQVTVRSAQGGVLRDVVTSADGTFAIDRLPTGTYLVEVSAPSFEERSVTLDVRGRDREPLRVELDVRAFTTDVTVTAERATIENVSRTPPIVTVREASDFRRRPMATIGHALEGAAGVMVQQSTNGQVSPFLRGLTGYQVLNLVDGVRFNNTTFRSGPNQYLAFIDPSQSRQLEAMLGPASAQFGSDAMGGTIQVLTPAVDFSTPAGLLATGGLDLFAGSADKSGGAAANVSLRGRNLTGMFGGTARELRDLRAGGGRDSHNVLVRLFGLTDDQVEDLLGKRQRETGFTQTGVHGKVAARLGADRTVTAWYQRSEQTDVRGYKDLWGGLGRLQSSFEPQTLQFLYARYEQLNVPQLDWLSATFSVNAQRDGSIRQNLRFSDPIVRDEVGVDAFGYAVQAGRHVGSRHALVFGGEIYDEHVDAYRDQTDPPSGSTAQTRALYPNGSRYTTTGLFLQDEFEILRGDQTGLVAKLGGRFTHVAVRTNADANVSESGESLGVVDSSESFQDWTFNAGVTWTLNRVVSIQGLVGRGFRAPNLNDLGALGLNDLGYEVPAASTITAGALVGASDGEGVVSIGREVTDLTAEQLMNYELGVALNWDRLYIRVQGFDAELHSPIVRRTVLFPGDRVPASLAGVPVTPIAPTAPQIAQGVVSVATALDPRAVKAFVNEGSARYYGIDAVARHRLSARWSMEANYSYLVGNDLNPTRPVRRLPPQQGAVSVRYQPGGRLSWVEASVLLSGPQDRLSGGDITDERIGAARRRSDIADFFAGGLIGPFIMPGADGVAGTADDVFAPTGETVAQIRDRVLPIGATINGVTVLNDGTRVPLYTRTPGFVSFNLRAGFALMRNLDATVAVINLLDRNYRVHGSGIDAPGRNVFFGMSFSF